MQSFDGISFWWAIAIFAVIGLVYALRAFLGYRNVARDAEADYEFKQSQGMIDKRLSEEGYIRVYKRFHNPRGSVYVAGTIAAILILTGPAMLLLGFILEQVWQFSGRPRNIEPGFLVWQFIIFFSVIGFWVSISYAMSRFFHRYSPGTFNHEVEQELLEAETGHRDKPFYDNDFGVPPFMIIAGVVMSLVFILWSVLYKFGAI